MQRPFRLSDPYGTAPKNPPFSQSVSSAEPWKTFLTSSKTEGDLVSHLMFTVGEVLDRTVRLFPDNDALVFPTLHYRRTWAELAIEVERLARGMMAIGIRRGEKIMLVCTNKPEWVVLMFAAAKIGAVLMPMNINSQEHEISKALMQSRCENVFSVEKYRETDFRRMARRYLPELRYATKGDLHAHSLPYLRRVASMDSTERHGIFTLDEICSRSAEVTAQEYHARQLEVNVDDVVNMQYTSGTTGFPKPAQLTHRNIVNDAYWIGSCMNYTDKDRICIPVPLYHCFGCVLGIMVAAVYGATMVMLEKFDPVDAMMAIEKERCTSLYGVPTMYIAILDHPLFSKFDFSSIRTGVMSGAPCPLVRMEQTIERMGMREICVPYGLTEAGPVMTMTRGWEKDIEKRCFTVGQALPGVEVAVIDPRTHELAALGATGELCCRGYNVMKGYYRMPRQTEAAIDEYGWLHSGDLGHMDAEGYFYFNGRIKDIIIRGGENISAAEVETFLSNMPEIADVKVVGVPSKKYGEQPAAFIILKEGCDLVPADIEDFCRERIAWFKIPKYIHFVKSYPLTGSGKVRKNELKELAQSLWPDA